MASASRTRAGSAATASRHPRRPHQQAGPSGCTVRWPISPAPPCQPRAIWPLTTMPMPTPRPTVMTTRSRVPRPAPNRCSAMVNVLTSLSTSTVRPKCSPSSCSRSCSAGSASGDRVTCPVAGSTMPGNPMPMPTTLCMSTPALMRTSVTAPSNRPSTVAASWSGRWGMLTMASGVASKSVTVAVSVSGESLTPTANPAVGSSRNGVAGRPSVVPSGVPAPRTSTTSPSSMSDAVMAVTVDGLRPDSRATSARDRAFPSRMRSSTTTRLASRTSAPRSTRMRILYISASERTNCNEWCQEGASRCRHGRSEPLRTGRRDDPAA